LKWGLGSPLTLSVLLLISVSKRFAGKFLSGTARVLKRSRAPQSLQPLLQGCCWQGSAQLCRVLSPRPSRAAARHRAPSAPQVPAAAKGPPGAARGAGGWWGTGWEAGPCLTSCASLGLTRWAGVFPCCVLMSPAARRLGWEGRIAESGSPAAAGEGRERAVLLKPWQAGAPQPGHPAPGFGCCTEEQERGAGDHYGQAELQAWPPSAALGDPARLQDPQLPWRSGWVPGTSWLPTSLPGVQPAGDEPQVRAPIAGGGEQECSPSCCKLALGWGESSVPKHFGFTGAGGALRQCEGRGFRRVPPPTPRAPLLLCSPGVTWMTEVRFSPGAGRTHICPFCSS